MTFLWARMLWLLLLLPLLVAAYLLLQRRRKKYALRYASLSLIKEALGRGPGIRRHIPPILFLAGVAVMLFALSRPAAVVRLPSQQGTVILALDVSGSMRADDLKPTRLDAAKEAARAFLEKQPRQVRIGVVAFSSTAALVQAPTVERSEVLAAINRLSPQRGTAVGSGLIASLRAVFEEPDAPAPPVELGGRRDWDWQQALPQLPPVAPGSHSSAVIVLLSDGQSNQGPDPLEVAQRAANLGVRVYTVGVGSPEGTVLRIYGRSIRVRLDESALKSISQATAASYYKADSETDLRDVYEALSTQLVMETEKTELTAFFTAGAMAILLLAGTLSLLWFNRLP
jgi:Ca-activated chloride channel family protein